MTDNKKGIQDLFNDPKIKGFWIWTWGDGWVGPYFDNELWINLNEFVLRDLLLTQNKAKKKFLKNMLVETSNSQKRTAKDFVNPVFSQKMQFTMDRQVNISMLVHGGVAITILQVSTLSKLS